MALIALAATAFGFVTALARLAYGSGATPLGMTLARFVMLAAATGAWLFLRGRPVRLPRRAFRASFGLAILILTTGLGYLASVAFIPVSLAVIVFYTSPLIVGVLASLTGREPMTPAKAAGLLVAFVGLALALGPTFEHLDWRGIALAILAAASLALTILGSAAITREVDPLVLTFRVGCWISAAVGAYALGLGGAALSTTAPGIAAVVGATLLSVLGTASWFSGMALISPVRVALMFNLEPVVTIVAATALLGERLGPLQILGGALVLAALVATTLVARR